MNHPHPTSVFLAVALLGSFGARSAVGQSTGSVKCGTFGKTKEGKEVTLYTMKNVHGVKVGIIDFGAIVQRISIPDKHGRMNDVALGFPDMAGYAMNSPYFGATIGRYANRIAKGTFHLDGQTYHVPVNNGPNSLHGGTLGYDKRMWKGSCKLTPSGPTVTMKLHDPAGEQGYPGNVDVSVRFTLTADNELKIDYRAVADKDTPINLTNHSYFNLRDGGRSSIKSDKVKIFASRYTPVDSTLIPTGEISPVAGTPYDFRIPKTIGRDFERTPGKPNGYDLNFVLGRPGRLKEAAQVIDPVSGRKVEVFTTEPGIQFYSGNFLDGSLYGKQGVRYTQNCAFALEAQHYPDSPNHLNFPSTILKPGKVYRQTTEYRFSVVGKRFKMKSAKLLNKSASGMANHKTR